jgi:choline monooxygenase
LTTRSILDFYIDPDIRRAQTLPGEFYLSIDLFTLSLEKIFARTWQWVGSKPEFSSVDYNVFPCTVMPGSLEEPLLIVHEDSELTFLSNVCTHRANLLVRQPGKLRMITCGYHGRCFHLNGTMKQMPGFSEALDFPSSSDHLKTFPKKEIGPLLFTFLSEPPLTVDFFKPLEDRMNWFNFNSLTPDQGLSRSYTLDAHWALYCDNYLEGFHIPFVHKKLNQKLEFQSYHTDLYPYCNVQLGIASENEPCFEIPKNVMDFGKRIYAYYWWFFPNLMINIYTWGVSVNVVYPLSPEKTRIDFITFLLPGKNKRLVREISLHETEMEDEEVVLCVQKGVKSGTYKRGRFSPGLEKGVHHFHRLISGVLAHSS